MSGEFLFINATRLRLDLENFASFSHLLSLFRAAGIGAVHIDETVVQKDWLIFLSVVQTGGSDDPAERLAQVQERLTSVGVAAITVGPPTEEGDGQREKVKERSKRMYSQCVSATKELMAGTRLGSAPNIKKVKRVVQSIVDQILSEETSLIGLTTIRD